MGIQNDIDTQSVDSGHTLWDTTVAPRCRKGGTPYKAAAEIVLATYHLGFVLSVVS